MRKVAVAITLISALLFSVVAGIQFVKVANANPYIDHIYVKSPIFPTITIQSPQNNTIYPSNNLTLNLEVTMDKNYWIKINHIYYRATWKESNITIYEWKYYDLHNLDPSNDDPVISEYACELNLTGIPDGKQNMTVNVVAEGGYANNAIAYHFDVYGFKKTTFVIDTTPPNVSIFTAENKTYAASEVPLNFTVSESVSKIFYVLDGQENMTVAGNNTLTGLSNGLHNVTVYALDLAGNIGASETAFFSVTVPEPFPTVTVAAVSVAVVAVVVAAGLLVYFKKRKRSLVAV